MFQNVDREVQEMLGKYGPGETQQSNLYVQIIDDAAHFFAVLITIFLLDLMVCQHLLNIRLDLISVTEKEPQILLTHGVSYIYQRHFMHQTIDRNTVSCQPHIPCPYIDPLKDKVRKTLKRGVRERPDRHSYPNG